MKDINCTVIRGLPLAFTRYAAVSVDGPVKVGLLVYPHTVAVGWWWFGRRHNRTIARQRSRSGRYWLVCPVCGKRRLRLFVYPPAALGCRVCLKIDYTSRRENWRRREPKRLRAWLGWFGKGVGQFAEKSHGDERLGVPADPGSQIP